MPYQVKFSYCFTEAIGKDWQKQFLHKQMHDEESIRVNITHFLEFTTNWRPIERVV
jgi:hypothetical protein